MQDTRSWTPPTGVLGKILAQTAARVEKLRPRAAELRDKAARAPSAPSFLHALAGQDTIVIVGEVKRKSPSKGAINMSLDALQQAGLYERGGAVAVSVLTEEENFGGSVDDLIRVARGVRIPAIRKDFCIDPLQLLEARASGAAAMLLIARALPPQKLIELAQCAAESGLDALVEVRNEQEMELALELKNVVIGVNNRNLESLEISTDASERLIPLVPADRVVIFESGVRSRADVELAARHGANAVLVGSALSAAADPIAFLRELGGIHRTQRAPRN